MTAPQQKTLIYLIPYQLIPAHVEKFGFEIMREKNIPFKVFDLSAFAPHNHPNAKHDVVLQADFIQKVASLKEFDACIRETAKHSIYIDCINGMNGLLWNSRKIFRILKKYNAEYYVVEIGSLPIFSPQNQKSGLIAKIWRKIQILSSFSHIIRYSTELVGRQIIGLLAKNKKVYQLPKIIFSIKNEIAKRYLSVYKLPDSTLVPIHSIDYDRYLTFSRNTPDIETSEKVCVFVDQYMAHHPEHSKKMGLDRPVTAENYFPSMNKFFDFFEKVTGMRIVIAAHPAAQYEKYPEIFKNREIIRNKTVELVKKSAIVLTHNSTAISNAVLFNKPLILLATDEMVQTGYASFISIMAKALKVYMINVDEDFSHIDFPQYCNSETNYDEYLYSYIKTRDVADRMTWEFVADTVTF